MAMRPEVRYINSYVSGNLAYQPERKPQKKKSVQLPKAKIAKKQCIRVDVVALGGIMVALVLAIMLLVNMVQMNNAKAQAQVMSDYVSSLQKENEQLQNTYRSSYDLEEVREIASAMGMVPAEQAPHLQMQVVRPPEVESPTAWESFWAFIVGMFA
ncbi:MAG: hypothetical protein E7454_03230 [Ruminococcaceae bacterium]|nr:hypothetical protein [Oscillospiraceae bacterium]